MLLIRIFSEQEFDKIYILSTKPYNLTYIIGLSAIAMFADHKSVPIHRKPYKVCSIGGLIMKL